MFRFDSEYVLDGEGLNGLAPSCASGEAYSRQARQILDSIGRRASDASGTRYDSASTLIAARELEQVLSEVLRTEFAPRYAERYIPIEQGGVSPFAKRYIQKRITPSGLADYVNSADMPFANASAEEISKRIYTIGMKFGWSWFEMQEALVAGVPLSNELAMAAREAAEDAREIILLKGDASLNTSGNITTGFINDATVPTTSVSGVWSGKTPDQIIADFQAILATYRANSRRRYIANVMLLPENQIAQLEMTRLTDTGVSLRSYLLANTAGLDVIDVLPDLDAAGAAGADRGILYARDARVVRGVIPMPFQFVAPQEYNMEFQNHGVERIAGVEFRRPFGALYFDGI